jgi:ketopantoate hydroxymethyltransferase
MNAGEQIHKAVSQFVNDVKTGDFPNAKEGY